MATATNVPPTLDLRHGIRNWGMLGNDIDGDCVPAAESHLEMVHNVATASTWKRLLYRTGFVVPTTTTTLDDYAAYLATVNLKPGPYQGTSVAGYLGWLKEQGKITSLENITDLSEASIRAAMVQWTGVSLTLTLTQRAYDEWDTEKPWTLNPGEVPADLWHEVACVQYGQNYGVVTWGRMKTMTPGFLRACVKECWGFA